MCIHPDNNIIQNFNKNIAEIEIEMEDIIEDELRIMLNILRNLTILREDNYFNYIKFLLSYKLFPKCIKKEEDIELCINKACQLCFKKSLQSMPFFIILIKNINIIPRLFYIELDK